MNASERLHRSRVDRERRVARKVALEKAQQETLLEDHKRSSILPQLVAASAQLRSRLDDLGWPDATDINLKGGSILGPRKFRGAVNIGHVCNDGETNGPLEGWFATDGNYYVWDTWFKYRRRELTLQPSWLLQNILEGTLALLRELS